MSFLNNIFGGGGDKKEDIPSPKIETKPIASQPESVLATQESNKRTEINGMPELAKRIEIVMDEIQKRMDPEVGELTEQDKGYVENYWKTLAEKLDQMIRDRKIAFSDSDLKGMTKNIEVLERNGLLPEYPSEIAKSNPGVVGDLINYNLRILGFNKEGMSSDEIQSIMELIEKNQPKKSEPSSEKVPVGVA